MKLLNFLYLSLIATIELTFSYEETDWKNIVASLSQKISELSESTRVEMDILRNEIDDMKIKQTDLKVKHNDEISNLRKEMEEMTRQQLDLRAQVELLTARLVANNMYSDVDINMKDVEDANSVIPPTVPVDAKLTEHKRSYTQEQRIRRDVINRVAFYAYVSNDTHLGADQDIVFDHVETNVGSCFNVQSGVFVAPVRGSYVFSCSLEVFGQKSVINWGHIVINGQVVAKLTLTEIDPGTQMIVVVLNAGDHVSVQNSYHDRSFLGDKHSTFSGFLLYEDTTSNVIVG